MTRPIISATLLAITWLATPAHAQEIDASKPTNFYPLLDSSFEYNSRKMGGNLLGYRAQFIYPPSATHLILGEVPLLYNDSTEKFGLGDVRARYFFLPYRDYSQFFGAFGPSIDVFMPTGSFENGLGSKSWVVSPGVTAALMLAERIQAFPILSYSYTSKPDTDLIPEAEKKTRHGINLQAIVPIVFSPEAFVQVTPVFAVNDLDDGSLNRYIQEILFQYAVTPTVQMSFFWRGVFDDDDHTFRVGIVNYLM